MSKFTEKVKKIFSGRRTLGLACAISFITISGAAIIYAAPSNGYDPAQAIADGGWTSTVTGTHYNSYGKINYSDGTNSVVADAADIATIDEMVGNGKKNIKNAIKSVDADGRLGTSSWDESTYPDFESMANMIVASQSLSEAQTGTQAVNNKGEALYYKDQTASDTKDLTQTCTDNTGLPVYYQPATAANLTAGSAAFIDGQLILGTGADNDIYMDSESGAEYERLFYAADVAGWGHYTFDKDYKKVFAIICAGEPNMNHNVTADFSTTCTDIVFSASSRYPSSDRGVWMYFAIINNAKKGDVINMYGSYYTIRLVVGHN